MTKRITIKSDGMATRSRADEMKLDAQCSYAFANGLDICYEIRRAGKWNAEGLLNPIRISGIDTRFFQGSCQDDKDRDCEEEAPTCGKGLAENASLPAKLAEIMASVAENLDVHMKALDLKDHNARQEYDSYRRLAQEHREIAVRLMAVADEMAGYRDLPMGRHDELAMSDAKVREAFKKLIDLEVELMALLQKRAKQHQAMLEEMG